MHPHQYHHVLLECSHLTVLVPQLSPTPEIITLDRYCTCMGKEIKMCYLLCLQSLMSTKKSTLIIESKFTMDCVKLFKLKHKEILAQSLKAAKKAFKKTCQPNPEINFVCICIIILYLSANLAIFLPSENKHKNKRNISLVK